MKAIMKSIKPKACANIMNLIQSVLVTKNKREATAIQKLIDENGYADIYVYCSKGKPLIRCSDKNWYIKDKNFVWYDDFSYYSGFNGKVVFKFRCYKVEEIVLDHIGYLYAIKEDEQCSVHQECWIHKTCLTNIDLKKYLKGNKGYAIHISNLEIFDDPKRLSEFYKFGFNKAMDDFMEKELQKPPYPLSPHSVQKEYQLTKAPQNFCYVEVK